MLNQAIELYKQAYTGLSRSTWLLSMVMLVNRSGTMVIPFMTIYLTQRLHYSIAEAGYVMGLFGAGSIAGALLGGRLTDKIGFYPVQLITLSGGGIMFIILGQMRSYPLICVFTFLLSVVNEAFRPANAAAIAHYSDLDSRTRSFSLNRLAINLGWAVGGALGGFLASHNYTLLFWVDGLTNICAGILLRIYFPPEKTNTSTSVETKNAVNSQPTAYRDKAYLYFIGLSTLFAICFFQLFTTLPVYYKQELHLSVLFIGSIMAMNGLLIALFEMVIVFKLEVRRQDIRYISYGVLLVGLSFVILNFFHSFPALVAVASMIIITFGEMLAMPFMNSFWVSRTTPQNRGQYASLYTVAYAIAHVLGPTLGSQIVQVFNFKILWWVVGAICVVNAVFFQLIKKIDKARAATIPEL